MNNNNNLKRKLPLTFSDDHLSNKRIIIQNRRIVIQHKCINYELTNRTNPIK